MARRSKKQAGTGSPADDVQLVADFVRRLRRVALHPLALDEYGTGRPGSYLCRLVTHLGTVELGPDHTATVRLELPDEVQFESLATRLRSFTIDSDRLFWRDALDALDRLTGLEDRLLKEASQWYRQAWGKATERDTPNERAYRTGYRVGDDEDREEKHFTDIDMAYAWLYQDVAHGDEVSTGYFDSDGALPGGGPSLLTNGGGRHPDSSLHQRFGYAGHPGAAGRHLHRSRGGAGS